MGGSKRTSHCKWQMTHPRQRRDHPNVGIGKKEPPGGTPGSSFKSDRSGNFSGAHTTRTDINMTGRTVDNRLDAFYIGLPGTVGTPVRVRDLNTKGHAFAAILALSHPLHLPADRNPRLHHKHKTYNNRILPKMQEEFSKKLKFFLEGKQRKVLRNCGNSYIMRGYKAADPDMEGNTDAPPCVRLAGRDGPNDKEISSGRKGMEYAMQEHGLKLKDFISQFNLEVLNQGSDFDTARLTVTDVNRPGLQFHEFYDYFDPRRLQVIGKAEVTYLKGLSAAQRRKCFDDLFMYDIPALVISRGLDCFPCCLESAVEHEKTLLRTSETTAAFTSRVIDCLNRVLAPCITRHGVLLDIYGEGVMITGDSGVGKSEVAIELIMRGHRLVADDAVELRRFSGQLTGSAPELIRNYIELRGIGVIDVRQLFGVRAIKNDAVLDIVVHFEPWDSSKFYDRMGIEEHFVDILEVQVPTITIPVRPGRNLASIVEVAAMNNRYRKFGYNAGQELANRVDSWIDGKGR